MAAAVLSGLSVPVQAAETEEYLPLNRNGKVYTENGGNASQSCDGLYYSSWQGGKGDWLAYDISESAADRSAVLLAWYSTAWNSYDYTVKDEAPGASLSAYTVEINMAPGGDCPAEGWVKAAQVTDCTYHSGAALLDGKVLNADQINWVRLTVDGVQGSGDRAGLNIDLHSLRNGIADSWMFYGDSITAGGMVNFSTGVGNFADLVHALDPSRYPAQENGGIGGIFSTDGRNNIDRWLKSFPGHYVSIAYGTNDCWGNQTGAEKYYENTVYMINAVQAAGKAAILPTIPFSLEPGVSAYIEDYNAQIARIYEEMPDVIKGPDFYAYYKEHPDGLSADGVHPNEQGYNEMRQLWAKTAVESIYPLETAVGKRSDPGDVNADGQVSLADAVALVKYLTAQTDTLPAPELADLDKNGRLNGADLTLLKRIMLGSAENWFARGDYLLYIDYSALDSVLSSVTVNCGQQTKIENDADSKLITLSVAKLDPSSDSDGLVTLRVDLGLEDGSGNGGRQTLDLDMYQWVKADSGKTVYLDSARIRLDQDGTVVFE